MEIHTIDLNFFNPDVIASYLIETGEEPVLIETGPDTTFSNLEKSLNALGYAVKDIKNVFVTHIHLDHSGAAWKFARTGAEIYVHPNGAKHLIDPTRLVDSAERIYGDQMDELWGNVEQIPAHQVRKVEDGKTLTFGNVEIRAVETFGHASHHHTYVIDDVAITGDVSGIKIKGYPVLPPTPPPDINVELWQESLDKLREMNLSAIYPTHFGESTSVKEHLDELEDRLLLCTEWVGERLKDGADEGEMIPDFEKLFREILEDAGASPEIIKSYELADPFWMNIPGLIRYWKKFRLP